jgi:hypothetical protein
MVNKYMKKCLIISAIREMQIQTTMRHHLSQSDYFQNSNNKRLAEMWRKRNSHTLLLGMQISITIKGNSLQVPQKTKNTYAI